MARSPTEGYDSSEILWIAGSQGDQRHVTVVLIGPVQDWEKRSQ